MKYDELVFEKYSEKYVDQAVELAIKEFYIEKEHCVSLPEERLRERLTGLNTWLCGQPYGKVALYKGEVIGFLAFSGPWDNFHGKEKGVFSPVGGSAFLDEGASGIKRGELASLLLTAVAEDFVSQEVYSCALSRYAHDEEVGRSLVFKGFGIRCSDAVRGLIEEVPVKSEIRGVEYEELKVGEFMKIAPLRNKLTLHMSQSPIFFPKDLQNYEEWYSEEMRVFVAKADKKIVGFISVEDEGEAFLTEDEKLVNIGGAFFEEEYRGSGMAPGLLAYVCNTLRAEGYDNIGVIFETLNPNALHFWSKYFTSYTYSYERRFDQRMKGYREKVLMKIIDTKQEI